MQIAQSSGVGCDGRSAPDESGDLGVLMRMELGFAWYVTSLMYLFILIGARLFLNEPITAVKILGVGLITAGVIFPNATEGELKDLFGAVYGAHLSFEQNPLVGRENLSSDRLDSVFPLSTRRNSLMTEDIAKEIRSWLTEPDTVADHVTDMGR